MTWGLVFEQLLNGLQYGVMLFLMAAGLTLVFGIMNMVNLAHGSLYMVGAYLAVALTAGPATTCRRRCSRLLGTLLVGMLVEVVALRALYHRDHLDQVLATFGLILFFNELVAIIWGRGALYASLPGWLHGHIELFTGSRYPVYRVAIIVVGLLDGARSLVRRDSHAPRHADPRRRHQPRHGRRARRQYRLLYTLVFGVGAALAGLAGLMAGPIYAVQPGMGELILIQVFVVIVIGGIGSIRGALVGAIIVGVVDTLGRAFLKPLLAHVISPPAAEAAGPALASMLIYLLMAVVLALRPAGPVPARRS